MKVRTIVLCACIALTSATLEVVNQWSLMQFDFPPDPVLLEKFQPENTVPTGLEIGWDRLYLGIPRLRAGVPATLAWVPRSLPPGVSPVLQVYLLNFSPLLKREIPDVAAVSITLLPSWLYLTIYGPRTPTSCIKNCYKRKVRLKKKTSL